MARRRRRKKGSKVLPEEAEKLRRRARRTDAHPQLVATAKFLRGLLPGDKGADDAREMARGRLSQSLGRIVSGLESERPSATRELGLGAIQAWQALGEAQRRRHEETDVAILFTDLVGFSTWALEAGDSAALELLAEVGEAEERAVSDQDGVVVKRLGDGAMSVFEDAERAVLAALEAQAVMEGIEIAGHKPQLRAGAHLGRPRKVSGDFLGIDVNIAARVADAAGGGEVLVSDSVREALDSSRFRFGRRRRLDAPGAPEDLLVRPVRPRRRAAKTG